MSTDILRVRCCEMFFRALKILLLCRLREFRREPSALFFVIAFPLLVLTGLELAAGSQSSDSAAEVGITDRLWHSAVAPEVAQDHASTGASFSHWGDVFMQQSAVQDFKIRRGSQEQLQELLLGRDLAFVVDLDGEFLAHQDDSSGHRESVASSRWHYRLGEVEGSSPRSSRVLARFFHDELQRFLGRPEWLTARWDHAWVDAEDSSASPTLFYVPGLLALSLLSTSLFGTGMTLVVHRRENLLKRFLTTPMPRFAYLLSHLLSRQLIMIFEICVIIGYGTLALGFALEGSWWLFLLLCSLGTAAMTFLGMTLASRTVQASFYNSLANLCLLPMMIFGGVWFSTQRLPEWLAAFSSLLPLTPLVQGLREVAYEGAGFSDVLPELMVLLIYAVVFAALAHVLFIWHKR